MTEAKIETGLERVLTEIADRLSRQEEYTRRLEASLFALARLPDDAMTSTDFTLETITETPRPRRTPSEIRWPQRRPTSELDPQLAADEKNSDCDLLWAISSLVHEALIGLDKEGCVRVWNPMAEDLFGWTAEETVGKIPPFLPDDKLTEHERLATEARFGKPCREFQTIRRHKDGQLIRVELSTAGVGAGIAFTMRPIGFPCRPSHAEAKAPPTPLVSPLPADPVYDVHLQGLASVGRQVASVAHDFNNLLTIICGGSERLLEQLPESDECRDVVGLIATAGRQASDITRGLLDLACLGNETTEEYSAINRCDLASIVSSHAPILQGLLGSERSLVLSVINQPAEIAADPVRIGQVLLNLATNSRDAMPDGGTLAVEVDLAEASDYISHRKGPMALLTVSDTGIGMDADTLSRAFEPFFSTKAAGLGCGLGLSTVADIVTESGGHVIPESSPGTGTTIRILFPLHANVNLKPLLHRADELTE
ncbi:MAG: ATP-binding protein [Gemmataceae bacterium]